MYIHTVNKPWPPHALYIYSQNILSQFLNISKAHYLQTRPGGNAQRVSSDCTLEEIFKLIATSECTPCPCTFRRINLQSPPSRLELTFGTKSSFGRSTLRKIQHDPLRLNVTKAESKRYWCLCLLIVNSKVHYRDFRLRLRTLPSTRFTHSKGPQIIGKRTALWREHFMEGSNGKSETLKNDALSPCPIDHLKTNAPIQIGTKERLQL